MKHFDDGGNSEQKAEAKTDQENPVSLFVTDSSPSNAEKRSHIWYDTAQKTNVPVCLISRVTGQ